MHTSCLGPGDTWWAHPPRPISWQPGARHCDTQVLATATSNCSQLQLRQKEKDAHNNQKPSMGQGSGGQYNQTVGSFVQAGCNIVDLACVVYPCLAVCSSGPHVDVYRIGFRCYASLYHAQGGGDTALWTNRLPNYRMVFRSTCARIGV